MPLVLDTLFAGVCAFLLFFTAIRFYTKNVWVALAFAACALFLFGALAFLYISGRHNRKLLVSRDEKEKKLLSLHLSLSSDIYVRNLFKKAFGEGAKISGKRLNFAERTHYFCFKMSPITEDDAAAVIKSRTELKKVIYCCKASPEAAELCANFGIEICTVDNVYNLLKEKKMLPEKYVYEGAKKVGVRTKIRARFSRKLCAPLFWSGIALLALSYFTYFPVYYIVSGGILLLLAAVALVVN